MYPVTYEADYLRDRKRFTTFFRLILAIPWLIVSYVWQILGALALLISWVCVIFAGKYPKGLYNFVGGVLRFQMRLTGFIALQTDAFPPFGLKDDQSYPLRVNIGAPALKQSRFKALIRIILILPLVVLGIFMSSLLSAVAVIAWITIVFRGYQPAAIHNALAFVIGWETRARAYAYILRDEYPPVGDEVLVDVEPSTEGPPILVDPTFEQNDPYGEKQDPYGKPADPIQEMPFTGAPLVGAPPTDAIPDPPRSLDNPPPEAPIVEAPVLTDPIIPPNAEPAVPPQAPLPPQRPEQTQPPLPPELPPAPPYQQPAQPIYEQPTQPPEAPQYQDPNHPPAYPDPAQQYQQPPAYQDPNQQQYQDPNQQYRDPNQQYQDPNQQYQDPNQQQYQDPNQPQYQQPVYQDQQPAYQDPAQQYQDPNQPQAYQDPAQQYQDPNQPPQR